MLQVYYNTIKKVYLPDHGFEFEHKMNERSLMLSERSSLKIGFLLLRLRIILKSAKSDKSIEKLQPM